MVVLRRHLQIVVRNDADLPRGCCGSSARVDEDSAQTDADFLCRQARIFCVDSG